MTTDPALERSPFDARRFRQVMGHYPTGVTVVTALFEGHPAGMSVGSFTSASLEPPLVAFLPGKSSTTFPKIRAAGRFCANVLAAEQESVCRALATTSDDRFTGIDWRPAPSGSPILDGVVAWVDCVIETVAEAGDHYVVIGRVTDLDVSGTSLPLLFFQGGYGHFSQRSRAAAAETDLLAQLRLVDIAREEMQRLSDRLGVECLAVSLVGDEMVILGSAGKPRSRPMPTRLGQRIPHVPPLGAAFVAWADDTAVRAWLDRRPRADDAARMHFRQSLERVRRRGWSLALDGPGVRDLEAAVFRLPPEAPGPPTAVVSALSDVADAYEPEELGGGPDQTPNNIMAPVFGPDGTVSLLLALYGLPTPMTQREIELCASEVVGAAAQVTAALRAT